LHAAGDAFEVLYLVRGPNRSLFIVDRFHFIHHSPLDTTCRMYCNPYSPHNSGMVRVICQTPVVDGGDDPLMRNGIGKSVRRVIDVNGRPKTVHRRVLRREDPEGSATWVEYECEDVGNTEDAEQTFSRLLGFNKIMRNMRMNYGVFFLRTMVDHLNIYRHEQLKLEDRDPSGERPDVHRNKSRRPSNMNAVNMFGTVAGSLHGD